MRRLAVLVCLVLLPVVPAAHADASCAPGSLTLVSDVRPDPGEPRLREMTLLSDAMRGQTAIRVLLPDGYAAEPSERYPVLFLVHGAGDDQTTWTRNTDIEALTSDLEVIVVMPDGGRGPDAGWYSDWATDEFCWESYHVGELVPFVDASFRTTGGRAGRAIAGLSMGGFGAMSYAARHPDLFVAAGSFSGAVDTADGGPAEAHAFHALNPYAGTPSEDVWGDYVADEVVWRDHNPADLAGNLHATRVWARTGNGVPMPGDSPTSGPTESGVYVMNRAFDARLALEGVDHAFHDRGYGTHEWHYWEQDLADFLPVALDAFGTPDPHTFDHRTAEPSFDVYGWTFEADADRAKEFLRLGAVGPTGMVVTGSGTTRVVSPPVYPPGSRMVVTATSVRGSEASARVTEAMTDDEGRLAFEVHLGPPHAEQQYTAEGRAAEAADPAYWTTARVEISPGDSQP